MIGGNGARDCSDVELTWTCKQQITLANLDPNEYRRDVNSSGLVVYKGSNARDRKVLIKVKAESK